MESRNFLNWGIPIVISIINKVYKFIVSLNFII
jgi:hypothetical protein